MIENMPERLTVNGRNYTRADTALKLKGGPADGKELLEDAVLLIGQTLTIRHIGRPTGWSVSIPVSDLQYRVTKKMDGHLRIARYVPSPRLSRRTVLKNARTLARIMNNHRARIRKHKHSTK